MGVWRLWHHKNSQAPSVIIICHSLCIKRNFWVTGCQENFWCDATAQTKAITVLFSAVAYICTHLIFWFYSGKKSNVIGLTWDVLFCQYCLIRQSTEPCLSPVSLTSRPCLVFDVVLWTMAPHPHSRDDHRCSKSHAGGVPITEPPSLRAVREECVKRTRHGRFLSLHSQFLSFLPLMRGEWGKIMSEGQPSAPSRNLIRTELMLSKRNLQVLTDTWQL